MSAWIGTYTGRTFYPANPKEGDINIRDIAHALSLTCRYNGHCKEFYSVAEHSCRLCDIVSESLRLQALMDDSAETYLGDMPSLLKHNLFPKFRVVEANLRKVIFHKFGIITLGEDIIKKAEYRLLAAEIRDLMNGGLEWYLPEKPLKEKIIPWPSKLAEQIFLHRFLAYKKKE